MPAFYFMKEFSNLLIIDGGTVKTSDEGVVEGLGIVFTSESDPDAYRDFFTDETFVTKRDKFTVPLYYNHGIGAINDEIGEATLTKTDKGWYAEAHIDLSDALGKKVYEAVKEKPHGFSTGALQHLVKRVAKSNNTNFLKKWVVGELSLTEKPAERKAVVQAIKSVDGEVVTEDWIPDSPVVSAKNADGEEVWNIESDKTFAEFVKEAALPIDSIEIKYTSGTTSYNVYTYDEDTGKGADIFVTEYGSADELLARIGEVIQKAKFNTKSEPEANENDFEKRVMDVIEKFKKDLVEKSTEDTSVEELKQELADLKATLSEREDALAQAIAHNETLQILAGAKEAIEQIKGK
jgi:hypothetical protein